MVLQSANLKNVIKTQVASQKFVMEAFLELQKE